MNKNKSFTSQLVKLAIEIGPLVLFFIANSRAGIFVATGVFMVAIIISCCCSYLLEKKIPILALVTAVVVIIFGGLTLLLNDALFIKIKPTIVNLLFAFALFTGLAFKRLFLKIVFSSAFDIEDEGWRVLTYRWGFFFIFLAILNEIVWRSVTTDMWVNFKVFAVMPITIIFSLFQLSVVNKYKKND